MVSELEDCGGVLCIDNLLDLIRAGDDDPNASVASFFLPFLERGELRMVVETTEQELATCKRLLPGLTSLFRILPVKPFDEETALEILYHEAEIQSKGTRKPMDPGVPKRIYRLFGRFMPYACFPGGAVPFLRKCFRDKKQEPLTEANTVAVFSRRTGLPVHLLDETQPLPHADIRATLAEELIGQPAALDLAAGRTVDHMVEQTLAVYDDVVAGR